MIGVYLSGTGNTKHCIEKFVSLIDPTASIISVEDKDVVSKIRENDEIVIAYPTQFSNMPYMVRDFINKNGNIWAGKKVICMTTMALFSGDGTGCCARVLKKHGAKIIGGMQIIMPDSIGDNKLLKKPIETSKQMVKNADIRIEEIAKQIKETKIYPQEGLSFWAHLAGLFGQRLWFYNKTTGYCDKVKISDACIGCGLCVRNCPMNNLAINDGKATASDKCAMCYRCLNICPKQAITILGKQVYEQCRYEKYKD
ncbi:MAG: EFR1 family ferrodoxin [Lachnospiraceae bacterium]|nr:EFR1 family ferrodoxin [Lachnospiraceae bacterium]